MFKKSPIHVEQGPDVCGPIPALLSLFFSNATWIESQQFILQIKEVGQILFLKRRGLFNAFPNLGRKVIKSATKEEIFFLICPS